MKAGWDFQSFTGHPASRPHQAFLPVPLGTRRGGPALLAACWMSVCGLACHFVTHCRAVKAASAVTAEGSALLGGPRCVRGPAPLGSNSRGTLCTPSLGLSGHRHRSVTALTLTKPPAPAVLLSDAASVCEVWEMFLTYSRSRFGVLFLCPSNSLIKII